MLTVTPYAGVWIEICRNRFRRHYAQVTPYAGVWIEICLRSPYLPRAESLPTRECGLKFFIYR